MTRPYSQRTFFSSHIAFPLILIRHGQAIYTHEEDTGGDIVQGVLSKEAQQTIQQSSEEIVNELHKHHISHVQLFSCPKNRCLQTAAILEENLENSKISCDKKILQILRDVKVIGSQDNIPNSYTRWEEHMLPNENWYKAWKRKTKEGMRFFPGEESPQDVLVRIKNFLNEMAHLQQPTLLVCHEEILGAIAEIFDLPIDNPSYGEVWYMYPNKNHLS